MQRTTKAKVIANLDHYAATMARNDEQYFIHDDAADINPDVLGIPQEPNREPVAVLISPKRYAWLISRSAANDD